MTKDEALKLALEALKDNQHLVADNERHSYVMVYNGIIEKCEEALAQQEQEPVAYWIPRAEQFCIADPSGRPFLKTWEPLYTTPPKRPWVGLTDEEVLGCLGPEAVRIPPGWSKLTRAIEAKLKEKNFD